MTIAAQLIALLPAAVTTSAAQSPAAPPFTAAPDASLLADFVLGAEQRGTTGVGDHQGDRPARPVPPVPEPERIVVNRTVPRVTPRATEPTLSAEPTDREFFDAHIFAEPLVPNGATTADDNRALGQVLRQYLASRNRENVSLLLAHLQRFPASPWRASLLANTGTVFSQHGYYTRAFESWNTAWQLTKDATDPRVRAVADYAIAEWLDLMSLFGDVTAIEGKLKEVEGRTLSGSIATRINLARNGLWILKNRHELATPSARSALASWLYVRSPGYTRERARAEMTAEAAAIAERSSAAAALGVADPDDVPAFRTPKALSEFHARPEGTSLRELANLAGASGLRVRMAYRPAGAPLVTPAIAHLRPGHYTLVVKHEEGRVLLRDAILGGGDVWMSRAALDEESSGYWLIPDGALPNDWRAVQDHEANVVIGRCHPGHPGLTDPGKPCPPSGGSGGDDPCSPSDGGEGGGCANPESCPPSPGMPTYLFHPTSAGLRLLDTPVGYTPPRGPAAFFTLSYHQHEVLQPVTFTYSNLGPLWTFNWLSYVQEMPAACAVGGANCYNKYERVFLRGSGAEAYRNPDANGVYPAFWRSRAVLVKVSESPVRFERRLPDGSVEVFTQPNGAPSGQRKVFLTSIVDPQGQTLQMTYDGQLRMVALTDAIGQVTTISYDHPTDELKITKVTDPFGRFATFTYTRFGQLASITDVLGMKSSFGYVSDDFISMLATPYGTTTFRHVTIGDPRMIEATDPLGGTERLEYHLQNTLLPDVEPAALVPTGFSAFNEHLQHYITLYWSKRQWALHPGDITKATQTQWLLYDLIPEDQSYGSASSVPRSIKKPLENRVWYAYPGQGVATRSVGTWVLPERVGRVLDDGSSQIRQTTFNTTGHLTSKTDPLNRKTSYVYAANGVDLIEVRQTTGGLNDLLVTYNNHSALHLPQTITGASGRTTAFTYNANGQVLTSTNAKSETTTHTYDPDGYLLSIEGAAVGSATTFGYDVFGRIRTVTSPGSYTVTTDYDAMDRPVKVTYPDGTYDEFLYDRLDLIESRDRAGRRTRRYYDAARRLVAVRDPAGRIQRLDWCTCGSFEAFVDAKEQRTSWQRDVQGRIIKETRADGTTETTYTYDGIGRLSTIVDPKNQVAAYVYHRDDSTQSVTYTNTTVATPAVSYTYDANYGRLATMIDGTGTTTYSYVSLLIDGATEVATVDGPLANDTVVFAYDELGRVAARTINGVGVTLTYDALGRIVTEATPAGNFTYTHDGSTERVASVTYPNGQITSFAYFGNAGNKRLQTIHNTLSGGATLSKFEYTYDATGLITSWQEQADSSSPTSWQYRYDSAGQLTEAHKWSSGMTPAILERHAYAYDAAGNRTIEQQDDVVSSSAYNALNRLINVQPGGDIVLGGTVSEPSTLAVAGRPVDVDASNRFRTTASIGAGTTSVTLAATDASGNQASATYNLSASGTTRSYTYDDNGNVLSDGVRTFEWDARNRLHAVTSGGERWEYSYNGDDERVREKHIAANATVTEVSWLWCGHRICEQRDSSNAVTERVFSYGIQRGGVSAFFTVDHLGSVREITDGAGAVVARASFTPYGKPQISGPLGSLGFAGTWRREGPGIDLTLHRVYDATSGRWLSEDPIGLSGGQNLHAYVLGNPISWADPDGLDPWKKLPGKGGWEYRHDGSAGGNDPPHTQYRKRGREYARRVYKDKTQAPHGKGVNEDIPKDVIQRTPPNNKPGPDGPGQTGNNGNQTGGDNQNTQRNEQNSRDRQDDEGSQNRDMVCKDGCPEILVPITIVVVGLTYVTWKVASTCTCVAAAGPVGLVCIAAP